MRHAPPVIAVHNWLPDFNSLAGGLLAVYGVLSIVGQLLFDFYTWPTVIEIWVGLTALVWWRGYSRVIVTTETLTLVGCGLWRRPRYVSTLAELKLEGQWALADLPTPPMPTLNFYTDWDWDTPTDYLIVEYRGEAVTQFFSLKQYARIQAVVAQMAAHLTKSAAKLPPTPPHA